MSSGRFCAWRGASDRRYIATVYAVDPNVAEAGLPDFSPFLLLTVAYGETGRRVLDVTMIDHTGGRRAALANGLAMGADEWHVYPLADDPAARSAMSADLRARHGQASKALCA